MTEGRIWVASDLMFGLTPKQREKFRPKLRKKHNIDLFYMWESTVAAGDAVLLLGNVAGTHPTEWFETIKAMPGKKALFISELETNRSNWYLKYGFDRVVSFGQSLIYQTDMGNVMFSALPAQTSVLGNGVYFNHVRYLHKVFDNSSSILNIHGYANGNGKEMHNTFDASISSMGNHLKELNQILELKFK